MVVPAYTEMVWWEVSRGLEIVFRKCHQDADRRRRTVIGSISSGEAGFLRLFCLYLKVHVGGVARACCLRIHFALPILAQDLAIVMHVKMSNTSMHPYI